MWGAFLALLIDGKFKESGCFMLVGAALASAIALEKTGGATFVAQYMVSAMDGYSPVAVLSGLGQTGESFCRIFGTTVLFDEAQLAELYPTEQDYLDAVTESLQAAVDAGFLLAPDATLIGQDAETSGIGGP